MPFIFVYGTLKRGCKNHRYLAGQTFVGQAQSAPGFRMYDLGDYPGLVADASEQAGAIGEIWEVDDLNLKRLDAFEGTREGLYERVIIPMRAPYANAEIYAYLYLRPVLNRVALGPEWIE